MAAVQDGRHLAVATQAAARTFALTIAKLGIEFE
jgi:hypothetical protein